MSELGRAVKHLESANALLARIRPLTIEEQVQLSVDVSVALRALRCADAGDMDAWLDAHCRGCGALPADVLTDDGRGLCARCATRLAQDEADDVAEFGPCR